MSDETGSDGAAGSDDEWAPEPTSMDDELEYGLADETGTSDDAGIHGTPPEENAAGNRQPEDKYCHNCGERIDGRAEICPECGVRQSGTGPGASNATGSEKDPAVAALLSFVFVGAGQLYNGQVARGIVFFVGFAFGGGFLSVITFGLALPLMFLMWVFAVFDAYDQAKKINAGDVEV